MSCKLSENKLYKLLCKTHCAYDIVKNVVEQEYARSSLCDVVSVRILLENTFFDDYMTYKVNGKMMLNTVQNIKWNSMD